MVFFDSFLIKPKIFQDYELNDIEVYPDFEEPDNFMKLFRMITSIKDYKLIMTEESIALIIYDEKLFEGIHMNVPRINSVKSFLQVINVVAQERKEIAGLIKNARWKY